MPNNLILQLQGVNLAVCNSPAAIGTFGGLLESISMAAHRASGNTIDNIMVVREFIIFWAIKHHPVLQLQEVTIFGKSDQSYILMSNIIFYYYLYHRGSIPFMLAK